MQGVKDYWQELSGKTKKVITAIATGTIAVAIIDVLALKFGLGRGYSTLFAGLSQEGARQAIVSLSEQGVGYRSNDREGAIRVSSANVNQIRIESLSTGYPKSGFSYDIYRNNTGLMTTESDKKQYTLYELQDRLRVQIRLFDGVRDAKVAIAGAGEPVYAYGDNVKIEASTSVVVTMMSRRSPSDNGAAAIKSLITISVRGMDFTNVTIFGTGAMVEAGSRSDDGDYGNVKSVTVLTSLIESNIAVSVCRALEKLYGQGKTTVSVKGAPNMERLIQGNIQYTTPEKIDEQGRTGLLYKEDTMNENSGIAVLGSGGAVGADTSTDTPGYTNRNGTQTSTDLYASSSAAREWLYDSVKEQCQVDLGALGNITISIVIDTDDTSIPVQDLISPVADSAGISRGEAWQKMAIIRILSSSGQAAAQLIMAAPAQTQARSFPFLAIIAVATGGILILLLFVLLLAGKKRRKRDSLDDAELTVESTPEEESPSAPAVEIGLDTQYRDEEMEKSEQILNLRMQHNFRLKQNIGELVDQDSRIAAKLMQSWLRGEGDLDGGECIGESNSK